MEVYVKKPGTLSEREREKKAALTTNASVTSPIVKPPVTSKPPALMMFAYAIKKIPKKGMENEGRFDWNVYRIEILEDNTFTVKLEKECINKAEAVANFQRLNANNILFGNSY